MAALKKPQAAHSRRVLRLRREHWEQMAADVLQRAPEEACGLVAGLEGRSLAVYPVENQLHSPVRFRMDPMQQWRAFQQIEQHLIQGRVFGAPCVEFI